MPPYHDLPPEPATDRLATNHHQMQVLDSQEPEVPPPHQDLQFETVHETCEQLEQEAIDFAQSALNRTLRQVDLTSRAIAKIQATLDGEASESENDHDDDDDDDDDDMDKHSQVESELLRDRLYELEDSFVKCHTRLMYLREIVSFQHSLTQIPPPTNNSESNTITNTNTNARSPSTQNTSSKPTSTKSTTKKPLHHPYIRPVIWCSIHNTNGHNYQDTTCRQLLRQRPDHCVIHVNGVHTNEECTQQRGQQQQNNNNKPFTCRMHNTNDHQYADSTCMQQRRQEKHAGSLPSTDSTSIKPTKPTKLKQTKKSSKPSQCRLHNTKEHQYGDNMCRMMIEQRPDHCRLHPRSFHTNAECWVQNPQLQQQGQQPAQPESIEIINDYGSDSSDIDSDNSGSIPTNLIPATLNPATSNPSPTPFTCRMHTTNDHQFADPTCRTLLQQRPDHCTVHPNGVHTNAECQQQQSTNINHSGSGSNSVPVNTRTTFNTLNTLNTRINPHTPFTPHPHPHPHSNSNSNSIPVSVTCRLHNTTAHKYGDSMCQVLLQHRPDHCGVHPNGVHTNEECWVQNMELEGGEGEEEEEEEDDDEEMGQE
ncbi:hypothetical protein HK102_007249 [Quaeritorhiza haematococci]|nr:hypothetical protein HK102_007249 [Quaeritorhiza haematococci]